MNLKEYSTKELHDELLTRGGVEVVYIEPYNEKEMLVEGPATVLIIID
ncbi:BC1881 family protein [Fusobacterium varium]